MHGNMKVVKKLRQTTKAAKDTMLAPGLKRLADKYHNEVQKQKDANVREIQRCEKKLSGAGGQWAMCKDIDTTYASPIVAVTRSRKGPEGQPKGSVATSPNEIDAIIRAAYGKI